jgi:hypothetical protein
MTISYFVRYDITAPDLPAFIERYRKVHVPLVAKWPGLQRMGPAHAAGLVGSVPGEQRQGGADGAAGF